MATREEMMELADRCEKASRPDRELDAEIPVTFDWYQRRVTRLGLNGRTPGSVLWFPPDAPWSYTGRRHPPAFSGPRNRARIAAALRSRAQEANHG
jgi:hypothetical protein